MIKLLMVEDDEPITELLARFFDTNMYQMAQVVKPSQALNIIKKREF